MHCAHTYTHVYIDWITISWFDFDLYSDVVRVYYLSFESPKVFHGGITGRFGHKSKIKHNRLHFMHCSHYSLHELFDTKKTAYLLCSKLMVASRQHKLLSGSIEIWLNVWQLFGFIWFFSLSTEINNRYYIVCVWALKMPRHNLRHFTIWQFSSSHVNHKERKTWKNQPAKQQQRWKSRAPKLIIFIWFYSAK